MPEKAQTIAVNGLNASTTLAIAYGTLEKLEWVIKYAGENILIAYTPANWNYKGNEIIVHTKDNELTISGKMVHGESFDILGEYKKHVRSFLDAFESVKASVSETEVSEWQNKIKLLKDETILIAEEQEREGKDVDKSMNFSGGNMYVTYAIMAINVLVFIIMVASGVSLISPTGEDIVNWGGNFLPYTTSGDWWRLITCVFVHIGIIHLLFNMYALYTIGIYLEPMLGKIKYIVAYLCTGILASLVSLWWHETPVVSAGASGAIFGMYGLFLTLLSTNLTPKQVRKQLLQIIVIFVLYNLVYGMRSGVDNAAHIGGLISGLIVGYIYYLQLRKKEEHSNNNYQPVIIAAATIIAVFFYLKNPESEIKKR